MLLKVFLITFLLQFNIFLMNCDEKASTEAEPKPATCPEAIVNVLGLTNCTCTQTRELGALPNIHCDQPADPQMLKDMFKIMSVFLDKSQHSFGKLIITNEVEYEIEDNYFGEITFEEIYFGTTKKACKITRFHGNAFKGPISETAKIFMVNSKELGYNGDLYKSLLKLPNLKEITIEGQHLTHIPRMAFCESIKREESSFPFLESIRFHVNDGAGFIFIRSIGPRAFWNLPSLKYVSIESQDIRKVGVRSFGLPENSKTDQLLEIDLSFQWNENFTADAFLPETFADLNRPVELSLYANPYISYLPERSFRKFLEQNPKNRIRLGQLMKCDCNMFWLYDNPQFKEQFLPWSFEDPHENKHIVECRDSGPLWELKRDHFKKCLETIKEDDESGAKDEL